MKFSLSPVVQVKEVDLTTVIPAVPTSIGAMAGAFQWGPVEEIRTIASEDELVRVFGKPNNDTAISFFSAANFLSYSGNLKVVRTVASTAKNAVASGTAVLIKNENHYLANFADGQATVGTWAAKYPGLLGNSLRVSICDKDSWEKTLTETVGANASAGATSVTASASVAGKIAVGDWISFGTDPTKYKVVNVSTVTITLASGLVANVSSGAAIKRYWEYQDQFPGKPDTSTYAANKACSNDEVHVIVVDEDGLFTNIPGQVLEKFAFLSKAVDAKSADGSSIYYKNVINNKSQFVWWMDHPTAGTNWGTETVTLAGAYASLPIPESVSLTGGVSADVLTPADEIRGYDLFKNVETVDVNLVFAAGASKTTVIDLISNLAEYRRDCVLFISPELDDVLDNVGKEADDIVAWRNTLPSSSYVVADSGWKYQYDKYNDVFRWIPLNADVAGVCAYTDTVSRPWFSPAGYNRGQIRNVIKLAYNPMKKADRDKLFNNGVNPVLSSVGAGTVLFGDKTLLSKPSAFDAINVRRLFIILEKAIATAAQYMLFEMNDEFTRAQFVGMVEPYLREIKGSRGIFDFRVVCDETNNTPEVIDNNSFVGDIYIKPSRAIREIQLNFVAVRTGVEFQEIVGKF
jgi:phage tail sheath protein FI